jgi:hypothetical protein
MTAITGIKMLLRGAGRKGFIHAQRYHRQTTGCLGTLINKEVVVHTHVLSY